MAIWRSTLATTAVQVAATLVAADAEKDFDTVRDEVFAYLEEKAKVDDAAYETAQAEKPARSSGTGTKTGAKKGTGGKGKGKGGGGKSLPDCLKMELTFGAFEGVTLEELLTLDAGTADADYSYGDGEKDGRDYLSWLASDRNNGEYSRERARIVADANDIEYFVED